MFEIIGKIALWMLIIQYCGSSFIFWLLCQRGGNQLEAAIGAGVMALVWLVASSIVGVFLLGTQF